MKSMLRAALSVCAMELKASLRDRQAVVYVFVLPLVLYPTLFWVMIQGLLIKQGREETTEVRVLVAGEEPGFVSDVLVETDLGEDRELDAPGPVVVEIADVAPDDEEAAARIRADDGHEVDAVLVLRSAEDGGSRLVYDSTRNRSDLARRRVVERIGLLARDLRDEAAGGSIESLDPYRLTRIDLASKEDKTGFVLSFILPMMFVIMAVMGAFFPAVDLTAGEKERGTAETTLLLPIPRLSVHLGKILTVALAALVAVLLNTLGLLLAAEHLLASLGERFELVVPWHAFPRIAPLLLLFLVTMSALLVSVASFTKTFKQGQALIGAVQLVFIMPAMLVAMPGIELTPELAFVPVVQTVLAFKAVLQGPGPDGASLALEFVLVALSQLVYAAAAIWLAVRLGASEALLFGSERFSLRRLGALLRAR
ncbi:MAG: ABC transporter permease subunit [Planctomycetota bacterium]|nr:ABC transporter permease subunit [Planctomycetota bacterium]